MYATLALAAAVSVFAGGFFVGRRALEREWSQPTLLLSDGDVMHFTGRNADPVPGAQTRILRPMPLGRTRVALAGFTARDPLVVTVGTLARDSETVGELHVVLQNRGSCTVVEFEGVAYGFDAYGSPSKLNRDGQHFVAMRANDQQIAPGESAQWALPLHHFDIASLAVGHIDRVRCSDGTRWSRATL